MLSGVTRVLPLLLALVATGCRVHSWQQQEPVREAAPLTSEVADRFAYERVGDVVLEPLKDEVHAVVWSGTLHLRLRGETEAFKQRFEWWQAREPGRRPAILVTPILGGGESLARGHCLAFTAEGLHVALVDRGPRVLAGHWPVGDVEKFLRRAIAARRAVLDWVEGQEQVDPRRLAAFGISMGGIVTSVLLAVEPRLQSGVIALAGGDIARIVRDSDENRLVRYREAKAAEHLTDEAGVEQMMRAALPSDPARLARHVDPRRVLFVTSRWDQVVPLRQQELLWDAFGRPARYDLPSGHYAGILFLPHVMGLANRWLAGRFAFVEAPVERAER